MKVQDAKKTVERIHPRSVFNLFLISDKDRYRMMEHNSRIYFDWNKEKTGFLEWNPDIGDWYAYAISNEVMETASKENSGNYSLKFNSKNKIRKLIRRV